MSAHELHAVTPLSPSSRHDLPPRQGIARVQCPHPDGGWWVHTDAGRRLARRATSCLVEPREGDRVWLLSEGSEAFIAAVLERTTDGPTTLAIEGDASLRTEGQLTVHARAGLELGSTTTVGLSADTLRVQARTAQAALRELSVLSRSVFASLRRVTHVGEALELLVDTVTQRSKHSVRAIEGLDHTQAETIDQRARGDARIQAKHALVNGQDLVKMDGGQIHLG